MKKGIFCLEGIWDENIKAKDSIYPILELLEKNGVTKHLYHKCVTISEFEFFINKWKQRPFQKHYPILYLACHGQEGKIMLNKNTDIELDTLAEMLGNSCSKAVIFFGSCKTMNTHGSKLQAFLKATNGLALLGYKNEVEWISATAFEMLVLNAFQNHPFDTRGIRAMKDEIMHDYGKLHKLLDFRMEINKSVHFPRKRKTKA